MKFESIKKSATYLLRETAVTGRVSVAASEYIVADENEIVKSGNRRARLSVFYGEIK